MSVLPDVSASREKQKTALTSVVAAVFLALLKLIAGLATGSLGLLAEAAHSGLDLVAALVTFLAVRVSDRPADPSHHYGHGKVENLAALFETLLLLVTCAWICWEAVQRLAFKTVEVDANLWAFLVIGISITVDVNRSRLLYRTARKHHSQALEADALHFSTDIWSSAVVLVGLALVWLSGRLGPEWSWLAKGDAVAALGVALIVVVISLRLGHRAVGALLDAAPAGLTERIHAEIARVPGVQGSGSLRVRQSGPSTFVDLSVDVDRYVALEEAHWIATAVQERVRGLLPRGDVVVHVDPVKQPGEVLPDTVSALATRMGLRTHGVHGHEIRGSYYLDLHVEVPASLTVAEAHERVSDLEQAIRDELPHVASIHSHIEPATVPVARSEALTATTEAQIRERIMMVVREVAGLQECTHCDLRAGSAGYDVVLDCLVAPEISVAEAHRIVHEAEQRLRDQVPGVDRVLIHAEPSQR